MKTTKLVLGILSIRIFVFVLFQSSAAGMANALAANGEVSGTTSEQSPLCSSSKQNTLRGAPVWFWVRPVSNSIYSVSMFHNSTAV